jgi:hypothetical protein
MKLKDIKLKLAVCSTLCSIVMTAWSEGSFTRISSSLDGGPWVGDAMGGVVSPDGTAFAWYHLGALFELNIPTGRLVDWNVYLYYADRDELVPANIDHEGFGVAATRPALSDQGRFVAFLGADRKRVYVRDMVEEKTTWINPPMDGDADLNGQSQRPLISADGAIIAYSTDATNIIPGDSNNARDILIYHRETGETRFGMLSSEGAQFAPSLTLDSEYDLSADGRFLFFSTTAAGVHPDTPPLFASVYRRNLQDGTVDLVSRNADGEVAAGTFTSPRSSYDGGAVAMGGLGVGAFGTPMIAGYTHFFGELYAKNIETGMVWRVTNTLDGADSNGLVTSGLDISGDGTQVAFGHSATNLAKTKTIQHRPDMFLATFDGDEYATVTHLSLNTAGQEFKSDDGNPHFAKKADVFVFATEAWHELTGENGSGDDAQVMAYYPNDPINGGGGVGGADPSGGGTTLLELLYSLWSSGFNLQGSDAEYTSDPDGDGYGNLSEYLFATNPTRKETKSPFLAHTVIVDGLEYPAISIPQRVGGGSFFSFNEGELPVLDLSIEASESLAFDNLLNIVPFTPSDTQGEVFYKNYRIDRELGAVESVFFRIVISMP